MRRINRGQLIEIRPKEVHSRHLIRSTRRYLFCEFREKIERTVALKLMLSIIFIKYFWLLLLLVRQFHSLVFCVWKHQFRLHWQTMHHCKSRHHHHMFPILFRIRFLFFFSLSVFGFGNSRMKDEQNEEMALLSI